VKLPRVIRARIQGELRSFPFQNNFYPGNRAMLRIVDNAANGAKDCCEARAGKRQNKKHERQKSAHQNSFSQLELIVRHLGRSLS
jgi:hypothetical protein